MAILSPSSESSASLGLLSVILGSVGTLLFFMPILGIPLAAAGLALGIAGFVAGCFGGRAGLRWPLAGILVCSAALGIGIAIAQSPEGFWPSPTGRPMWQSTPDRPYVPPPALPPFGVR